VPAPIDPPEPKPRRTVPPKLARWQDVSVGRRLFLVVMGIGSFVGILYVAVLVSAGLNAGASGFISIPVAIVLSMIIVRTVGDAIGVNVFRGDPNQRDIGWQAG